MSVPLDVGNGSVPSDWADRRRHAGNEYTYLGNTLQSASRAGSLIDPHQSSENRQRPPACRSWHTKGSWPPWLRCCDMQCVRNCIEKKKSHRNGDTQETRHRKKTCLRSSLRHIPPSWRAVLELGRPMWRPRSFRSVVRTAFRTTPSSAHSARVR